MMRVNHQREVSDIAITIEDTSGDLINENSKEIYFNDQRVFWFSVDWKKIIKRFNEILK